MQNYIDEIELYKFLKSYLNKNGIQLHSAFSDHDKTIPWEHISLPKQFYTTEYLNSLDIDMAQKHIETLLGEAGFLKVEDFFIHKHYPKAVVATLITTLESSIRVISLDLLIRESLNLSEEKLKSIIEIALNFNFELDKIKSICHEKNMMDLFLKIQCWSLIK